MRVCLCVYVECVHLNTEVPVLILMLGDRSDRGELT